MDDLGSWRFHGFYDFSRVPMNIRSFEKWLKISVMTFAFELFELERRNPLNLTFHMIWICESLQY